MDLFKNFAYAELTVGIDASVLALTVGAGESLRFPTPPFNFTIFKKGVQPHLDPNVERARCTAIIGDTWTIVRTSPFTHNDGGAFYQVIQSIGAEETTQISTDIAARQASDSTLTALAAFNTNGLLAQTAADTFIARTISGTSARVSVSNGDGVAANPTINIDPAYVGQSSITTLGTITTGVWNGTAIALGTSVSGNLAVSHLDSGTGASATTFWRGDGVWSVPAGGGTIAGSIAANQIAYGSAPNTITGSDNFAFSDPATLSFQQDSLIEFNLKAFAAAVTSEATIKLFRSRGTIGSPTVVVTGDSIGEIKFIGQRTGGFSTGARIEAVANGTIGADCPMDLNFYSGANVLAMTLAAASQNATFTGTVICPSFRMTTTPTNGFFLQCDGSGNGLWAAGGGGISGLTTGTIPKAASATTITDSILVESGGVLTATGRIATAGVNNATMSSTCTNTSDGRARFLATGGGGGNISIVSADGTSKPYSGAANWDTFLASDTNLWIVAANTGLAVATATGIRVLNGIGLAVGDSLIGAFSVNGQNNATGTSQSSNTGDGMARWLATGGGGGNISIRSADGTSRPYTGAGVETWATFLFSDSKLWMGGSSTVSSFLDGSGLNMIDAYNLIFGATTGTKIGTATSQKLGFWNKTPIVQPTTAIAAGTFVANTSGIADDSATFDGYTVGQIIKILRNVGLAA